MKTLHLINKPGQPLKLCQRVLADNDALMLIEDGVYLLSAQQDTLNKNTGNHIIYALHADIKARAVEYNIATMAVTVVDYTSFVKLTVDYDRVISWF
ncbi:MAG: sulfurtransferase complex subunit TusB [Endozoicomonas sp. (ex Botrylloides leachii)]|nr:sulfurtransferase complex subunit TusB [Endozoicomonas sp. (ex Botrylloides leachii)]